MGKKIYLSESQFKKYMRMVLNENTAPGSEALSGYRYYSEMMMRYANAINLVGNSYSEIYRSVLGVLKNMGIAINGMQESEEGVPCLKLSVDVSSIKYNQEDYGDYPDGTPYQLEGSDYAEIIERELYEVKPPRYFESINVSMEGDGILVITPIPENDFNLERIKEILPDV